MSDELSAHRKVLPPATAHAWKVVAQLVPAGGYPAGGTALGIHLHHRISRDLDFFVAEPFDPVALRAQLEQAGSFATTELAAGTLNGVLDDTKIQFLDARTQRPLAATTRVAGIEIVSVRDLLATKLKVIADRGELRDYFDIPTILEATPYTLVEGIRILRAALPAGSSAEHRAGDPAGARIVRRRERRSRPARRPCHRRVLLDRQLRTACRAHADLEHAPQLVTHRPSVRYRQRTRQRALPGGPGGPEPKSPRPAAQRLRGRRCGRCGRSSSEHVGARRVLRR